MENVPRARGDRAPPSKSKPHTKMYPYKRARQHRVFHTSGIYNPVVVHRDLRGLDLFPESPLV